MVPVETPIMHVKTINTKALKSFFDGLVRACKGLENTRSKLPL